MSRYLQIGSLCTLLLVSLKLFAAEEEYSKSKTGGTTLVGKTITAKDDKWPTSNPAWSTIESHRSVIDLVILELNEDGDTNFNPLLQCAVDLQIELTDSSGSVVTYLKTLTLNFDTAFGVPFKHMEVFKAEGYHKIKVTVLGITYSDTTGLTVAPSILRITATILIDRTYKFDCDEAMDDIDSLYVSAQNRLKIWWVGFPGAEEYDVEWTFYSDSSYIIDDYAGSITMDDLFLFNATRISTSSKLYYIELIYPDGYIFYRVRPIHYDQAKNRIPGKWTSYGKINTLANLPNKWKISGHQPKLNWQFTMQFAEEAKRKVSLTYLDGSLRSRQSLAYNSSIDRSLISETVYDHIGRAAVSTLPVPTGNAKLQFSAKFNKYSGTAYEWSHFETGDCSFVPYPMDSSSGSAKYYSTTNTDTLLQQKFLPRAFGYPFTVTEFTADQTNRIKRQSGVGKYHTLGTDHETKYFYGTATPKQLDRLFGSEAGWSYHYLKNMVIDPNGQASVSYIDAHGRVIATALGGDAPSSLSALPSNPGTATTLTDTILKNTMSSQWGLLAIHNHLVSSSGSHKVKYKVTATPLEIDCGPTTLCFDAFYKLKLEIRDACNFTDPVIAIKSDSNYNSSIDTTCGVGPSPFSGDLTTTLPIGSFNISKTLTIPQSVIDYYSDWFLEHSVCLADSEAFIQDAIHNIDFTGCNITCEECLAKLGTLEEFKATYLEMLEATGITPTVDDTVKAEEEWNQEKQSCNDICDASIDPCAQLYQQMLADVSPGGQYCRYEVDQYGEYTVSDPNSLLYTAGGDEENYKDLELDVYYEDEMGNPALVVNTYYVTVPPEQLTVKEFVTMFQSTWAKALVEYHPEYCYYTWCLLNEASNEYDKEMLNTETFAQAWSNGYFNPLGDVSLPAGFAGASIAEDPFFDTGGLGVGTITGMREGMYHFPDYSFNDPAPVNPFSVWAIAVLSVNKYTDPDFTTFSTADTTYSTSECTGNEDQIWKIYRGMYLAMKFKFIDYAREEWMDINDCESNICIGIKHNPCQAGGMWAENFYSALDIDTVDCEGSSPFYDGDYIQRATHFDACTGLSAGMANNTTSLGEFTTNALPTQCKTICESYADGWIAALSGCTMTTLEEETIREKFIKICEAGCDGTHPWGSTSTPPGVTIDPDGESDFADVLQNVLGISPGSTGACNALQITSPASYEAQLHYNEYVIVSPDDCLCDKIDFLKDEYALDDYGWPTFLGFLNFHYNTNLTQAELNDLEDVCDDATCFFLQNPIKISMELSCDTLGCIDCTVMQSLDKKIKGVFPSTNFDLYEQYYATYMNNQTGFNLTFEEYQDFLEACIETKFISFTDTVFPPPIDQTKYVVKEVEYFGGASVLISQYIQNGSQSRLLSCEVVSTTGTSQYVLDRTASMGGASFHVLDTSDLDLILDSVRVESKLGASLNGGSTNWELEDLKFKIEISFTTNQMVLCDDALFFTYLIDTADCYDGLMELAISQGNEAWQHYKDSVKAAFEAMYIAHCMSTVKEQYSLEYPMNEYHYTLYYYDIAGNLIKTVPPEGVKFITSSADLTQIVNHRYDDVTYDDTVYTAHKMETRYWYNTLNLPIKQYTPDGDTTRFWYDAVGRLVVSQSARQRPDTFSYTIYDPLGRITEVGRLSQTTDMEQTISQSPSSLGSWISGGSNRKEVTKTFYDASVFTVPGLEQENLRSRVASTTLMDTYSATITNYDVATHYSYDIAGNVKTIVNDIKSLNSYKERYKRIDYEYDLVSGNVNNVYYQRDSADQFIYEYTYDADNRILEAKTSRDGYIWDRDANYLYYNHGPLARTEIGEQQVQALDYAYSIQGWLKGINGLHLLKGHDMGQDGNSGAMQHKRFPVDVFGMNIGYFEGDYSQITKQIKWEPQYASSAFSSASKNLYNGNIRNIALSADKINPKTIGYSYGYDQLNRLVSMDAYSSFSGTNYEWPTTSNPLKDYRERVTYDANGNILTYNRHGEGTTWKMDSLEYNYYTDKNRLHYVDDKVSAGNYPEDIDDQSSGNYTYDASGNLITDTKEGITKIEWTTYGKVKKIIKSGTTLTFSYDPAGNRIYKKVATTGQPNVFTYYIRDAQGNIMSTYVLKSDTVRWSEQMMYGSSRLGIVNLNEITAPLTFNPTDTTTTGYLEGLKNYELTNHLGNVQAVVSDKKIGIDNNNDDINNYWIAEQLVAQDYYPFGMLMPERSFSYENYGFGFNGMLKDDEVKGSGNSYDFDARMFDTRIARWLSIDPKSSKYPDWSPYIFTFNNPVNFIDPDGQEPIKPQVGTIQQALDYFRQRGFTTVYQIRMFYLKPENEEGVKISQYPRYVYTENNGWIDLQHYFETIAWGRTAMDIMEEAQCAVGMSSCYSYEDLPTNRFAADAPVWSLFFAKYKEADGPMVEVPEKRLKEGEALLNAIEDHFSASGATKPENAPNYSNLPFRKRPKLPDDISEEKRLELINTGKYLPQNYSDRPYDLTKFPEPSPEYKIPKQ